MSIILTPSTISVNLANSRSREIMGHSQYIVEPLYPLPKLPELDWKWGYKFKQNNKTGQIEEVPLTLLDLLYPTGEDIYVAESWQHHWLATLLEFMLRLHFGSKDWLVFGNVFVHWGFPGIPPLAPDVTVVTEGEAPGKGESYKVGRDGVMPAFVVEVTSPRDPENDLVRKRWDYAAVTVPEYLIIDLWPPAKDGWRLIGYRLDGPLYTEIEPDEEGGVTFSGIGLRFVQMASNKIAVFDVETGQALPYPDDWPEQLNQAKTQIEVEATARARAEAEARAAIKAHAEAEAKARRLVLEIRELKAKYEVDDEPE